MGGYIMILILLAVSGIVSLVLAYLFVKTRRQWNTIFWSDALCFIDGLFVIFQTMSFIALFFCLPCQFIWIVFNIIAFIPTGISIVILIKYSYNSQKPNSLY